MSKLSKSAKLLSLLLNCLFWIILVGSLYHGFVTAWGCINLLRNPAAGISTIRGITLDYLQLYSENGIVVEESALLAVNSLSLAVYLVQVPLTCYGIQLLRKVLQPMVEQRPFSGTFKILRKMGWISILIAIISNVIDWSQIYHFEHSYSLSDLFLGSSITEVNFRFEPDPAFVIIAVVLFVLSAVFCYGEELQQLSDETL